MKTLVIGYGNTLRSDDGVGAAVAQQVAQWKLPEVEVIAVFQLTPELAAEMVQVDQVCFVDAWLPESMPATKPHKLTRIYPDSTQTQLNHQWSPHQLLHLTQTLYDAEPKAYHLLIPAVELGYGETLSTTALQGVSWAVRTLRTLINQEAGCYA